MYACPETNLNPRENIQESQGKLERRVGEFLALATPAERGILEAGRSEMFEALTTVKVEQAARYPETIDEEEINSSKRQRAQGKFKACCRRFCEETYKYSKIMDLLAGAAPEYVSLVWGAIKIVLVVQINHEEVKENIKEHLESIACKFETIDHLAVYMPKKILIVQVAKAYDLFSRFMAKAVKFYKLSKFSR